MGKPNKYQEQAQKLQVQALEESARILEYQLATSQHVRELVDAAEAGNAEAAVLAQQYLNDALAGNPTQAQLDFEQEARLRVAEELRRAGVTPESSPGAIRLAELEEAFVASREAMKQGNIAAGVGAVGATQSAVNENLAKHFEAVNNPLYGVQAMSQGAANLGKLSQYTPNPIYQKLENFGSGALMALGSTPNFGGNVGANLSGISSFLTGDRIGTSFKDQRSQRLQEDIDRINAWTAGIKKA